MEETEYFDEWCPPNLQPLKIYKPDLAGAIDFHIHAGPEIYARIQHYVDNAREARDAGMRAIVFKPLSFPTMDKALAAEKFVPGIRVFGGVLLDNVVGGLNPKAVEAGIKMRAKVIWMPLFDAENNIKASVKPLYGIGKDAEGITEKKRPKGITVLKPTGEITQETEEIMNIIADAKDVILDTTHLSPEEDLVLVDEAKKRGIEIVVDHPMAPVIGATIEQQKEMVKKGAYLDMAFAYSAPYFWEVNPKDLAEAIKSVGVEHCIFSSDAGNPVMGLRPTELFKQGIVTLLALGLTQREVDVMIKENPAKVLKI